MAETYSTLVALFTDIADAIREKTGEADSIVADNFPNVIRERLQVKHFKPDGEYYLTFSSPNSFTLAVNDATKHWDGTIEYFASNKTWTVWDGTTALSSDTSGRNNVLYLRGTGNTKIGYYEEVEDGDYIPWVISGTDVQCNGNIETILDYATVESGQHPTMAEECFGGLFMGCMALTKAPALPATTLPFNCYNSMFSGCTSLTQAPALPATTLTNYCYYGMFAGCTGLTQAPALPATALAVRCYTTMFSGCTSLTQAPVLPATTMKSQCYNSMFQNCTSLAQAPALPATTLADYCYSNMFQGCTSLTQAPALPATTLATYCYRSMFSGCTALTQAPALPATTLATYCYDSMFINCKALTHATALPATTLLSSCYNNMFRGCASLTQVPALPATKLVTSCYRSMFEGCTKIKLSGTNTGEYTVAYRIPTAGTGTSGANDLLFMFSSTGGGFKGTPKINTTYYLSNTNIVVGAGDSSDNN